MDTLLDSFSLTIKVGTQKVKFKIDTHQSTEEMFEKLKKIHPDCQHKKQQTLNKFKHDLQSKIQTHNVKQKLAQTIKYYLNKNFKQEHTATSDNQNQNTMESSLLTTQNVSFKASPIKQKIGEKQQKDSKIQPKSLVKNEVSGKSNPKKSATSLNKRTVCAQKNKSQPKKQNISQDLLKAYQTILQKSTQVDIKMMAKKCLEELGKLPAADRKMQPVVTRKHEVSVLDQKQQTTNQAQLKIEKHNRSPIYVLDIPSQRKELNFPQNYDQKFEMPKSSERSPYPKLFTNNRFNYMPQEQEAKYSTGQLSMSALRNTYSNYRKYNYLHNMV